MTRATSQEFQRNFGAFQHRAQQEPVEITRHGRREFVMMSAAHYDWLVASAKRAHKTAEASETVMEAVRRSQMDEGHEALDELLK